MSNYILINHPLEPSEPIRHDDGLDARLLVNESISSEPRSVEDKSGGSHSGEPTDLI